MISMVSIAVIRVAHFGIFEKLVFAITFKILKNLMEHIERVCSLESKLFLISICSIRILDILEVIAKTSFSKIAKFSTLVPVAKCILDNYPEEDVKRLVQVIGVLILVVECKLSKVLN